MTSSKKGFIQIASLSLISYPLSFVNQLLLSYYFGTSADVDSYFLSLTIVNFFIFFIPPAVEILTPRFFDAYSKDRQDGIIYLSRQLVFLSIPLTISIVILILFPKELFQIFAENSSSDREKYIMYLIFLSPLIYLIPVTNIINSVLLSFNKFIFQNIGRIIGTAFSLVFIFLLANRIGVYALIASIIFSNFFLLSLQVYELHKIKLSIQLFVKPILDVGFLKKVSVLLVGVGVSQIPILVERYIFIKFGEGTLSGFQYAFNLSQIPQNIIIVSLVGALWPRLLKGTYISDSREIFDLSFSTIKKTVLFFSFLSLFSYIYSKEIIYLIYYRGAFTKESLEITTLCFKSICLIFIPFGVSSILLKNLAAMQRSKMMTAATILSAVTGLSCMLIGSQMGSLQIISLNPVAASASMALLCVYLVFRANGVSVTKTIVFNFLKFLTKLSIVLIIVFQVSQLFNEIELTKTSVFIFLSIKTIMLFSCHVLLLIIFRLVKVQEIFELINLIKKRTSTKR